ncbi:MAG: hypothetical protein NTW31_10510 [Bacteroidetes bacterium]|nr:hypothetical protein [Bacteroidota bacterium]
MLIYRFRIVANEHDDFLREIEIQPNQTFMDFHHLLVETAELRNTVGAVFFMTDKKNKIRHEITLKTTKKQLRRFDDDLGEVVIETVTMPLMKDSKIKNYVEDPHQTMNYEFHGKEIVTMHIELFKILQSENMVSYPRVARKTGELRKIVELPVLTLIPESNDLPPLVRPVKVKPVPVPNVAAISKLDGIEEDLDEIKSIDAELADILEEEAPEKFEVDSQVATIEDGDEPGYGSDEQMEHLDDLGDMDQIDERYSNYREGSDDY